ncbi:MAG TPA: tetratricopeptide repeat protein [Acidobacteriaceae bacterium]
MKKRLLGIALVLIVSLPVHGQWIKFGADKTVPVRVLHPPTVGLTVKRIAFANPSGQCADELLQSMILPDFRGNNVDVIERQNLDQILAEHALSRGQEASAQDQVALGRILGPSVLIFVKTYECRTDKQPLVDNEKNFNGTISTTYISRTRVVISGSIESVNLTTGQVMGSNSFKGQQELQNNSTAGQPEFPEEDVVKEAAMREATADIHKIFFPWTDTKTLLFYDDKDCGLKQIYEMYSRGDHDGALKLADTSLEACKTSHKGDKQLARAFYDAGLTHLLQQDYDKAAELFGEAMQYKGADATALAAGVCREAQGAKQGLHVYVARLAQVPEPSPIAPAAPAGAPVAQLAPPPAAVPPSPAASPSAVSKQSPEERLKKLDQLFKQGLITKKQYDDKKTQILSEL